MEIIVQEESAPAEKACKQELGLFPGISNADYHKSPGESSSAVKKAAKALKLYRAYKDGQLQSEETESTIFGSIVHTMILEPELFKLQYAVQDKGLRKPTVAQLTAKKPSPKTVDQIADWERFHEENQDKIIISQSIHDNACRVRDAVYTHPEAMELFFAGESELSGWYLDQEFDIGEGTNLLCRYRPDYRTNEYILDVKTCLDASKQGFMKQIASFGYHVSAAHYLAGDTALKGTTHNQFIFVAAEKTPPYMVAVYVLSERDLELGRWIRRQALNAIKKAREEKEWPGYNNDIAVYTELPPYLFYEMERSKI